MGFRLFTLMPANRIEVLQSMLAQDPQSAFARYGLAMEYVNGGRLEDAVREFQELVARNPDYAAAYFHAGQTYEKLGRLEEARTMYRRGIEVTSRAGDQHARSELEAALDLLD